MTATEPRAPLGDTPWDDVAVHLRPRLRSDAWLEQRRQRAASMEVEEDRAYVTLAPGLHLTVVVDDDDRMTQVSAASLDRWGVSFDRAAEAAIGNLRRLSERPYLSLSPGLWLAPFEDGYASSRLVCLPPFAEELVAALPDRDILLLADASSPRALAALHHATAAVDPEMPLAQGLYRMRPGRLETIRRFDPSDAVIDGAPILN